MATDIIRVPPTVEVPNLDCMSLKDLVSFWGKWRLSSHAQAVTLVGKRRRAAKHAHNLAKYACWKATAISCRQRGNIGLALRYEESCDILYAQLPVDLHW